MENDYSGLLELAGNNYQYASYAGAAGAFAQMASGVMNYQALKTDAYGLQVQANSVELQAQQRANMLREQFINSVGAYQMNAAQRGVSVGSGSVRNNIETSAGSLGKDIATIKKSAGLQANALRAQSKVAKWQGRSALVSGVLSGISSAASAYSNYSIGNELLAKAGK
jgi:hypothetical protein